MVVDGLVVTGQTLQARNRSQHILTVARRAGITIPPLTQIATAAAIPAIVNHGRLIAFCPACVSKAELIWRETPLLLCMACGNAAVGGAWRRVALPLDLADLAASFEDLPAHQRNWEPSDA